MIESLADIEALTLSCRSEESKEYVAEAVLCYRSGAYRATIVSIWIAVAFDLIQKIKELAMSGDPNAKALEATFETYTAQIHEGNDQGVKSALEFERNILTVAREKLQLLDEQQYTDLRRLADDRHQCAHPSFQRGGEPYRPSAEQARLHLRNAIVNVLSQQPVQGRAALAALKEMVASAYFPADRAKAKSQLGSSAFANPTPALVNGFTDVLVFGFFSKGDPLYLKPQATASIDAIVELHRAEVEARLRKVLSNVVRDAPDEEMLAVCAFVAKLPWAWHLINDPGREKMAAFVRTARTAEVVRVLRPLHAIDALRPAVDERAATLTFEELSDGIGAHRLGVVGKSRALQLLSESKSWNQTNQTIDNAIRPIFSTLDAEDIRRIIRMPTEHDADLPGAGSYSRLIDEVRRTALLHAKELNELLVANRAAYLVASDEDAPAS